MTARDILGVRFSAPALAVADVFDPQVEARLDRVSTRLKRIAETRAAIDVATPPDAAEIARLFVRLATGSPGDLPKAFGTGRMARKLAASLCFRDKEILPIARSEHLEAALNLLRPHHRPSILLGTLDALLRTWDDAAHASRLRAFLRPRLAAYEGKLQSLRRARENHRYILSPDGADALGADMALKGRPFGDAIDTLALSARARTTPFCDQAAVAYARTALRTTHATAALHSLLSFLEERDRGDVHKRCLAPIILAVDARPNDAVQGRLETIAFHTVGDPAYAHLWAPWPGASPREVDELAQAHVVLQRWIAQRIITVFFETVAMDPDRREFWLQYARHVSHFRIYGDEHARGRFNKDARLRPFLRSRFCLGTAANGSNALMMRVKDRTIVEFGDIGNACYVYHANASHTPPFDKCLRAADRLKRTSMPLLFRSTGLSIHSERQEGRVLHHPQGWQVRFAKWFQTHLGI